MIAISWAVQKGDWWRLDGTDEVPFFSWQWKAKRGFFTRTGVYIGRFAMVYQTSVEAVIA